MKDDGYLRRSGERSRSYVRPAGKKSEEKADERSRRRKLLRTETDETVRIVRLMKQKIRRDERVKIKKMRILSRR